MPVLVNIALATICFTYNGVNECHPALLGKNQTTPTGEYTLRKRITSDPGYGGDVLQFHENDTEVFAIHRVWTLNPSQRRLDRLKSTNVRDRFITGGCVNVSPEIYERLAECCIGDPLIIK